MSPNWSSRTHTDPVEEIEKWVAKPFDALITGGIAGAITGVGVVVDVVFQGGCSALSFQSTDLENLSYLGRYQPLIQSFVAGPTLEQARNFAVMYGVNSGISCVLKQLRGKEDVQTSMVAAFGSGVTLSLVTGMRGTGVISVGLVFALVRGGMFKTCNLQEKSSQLKSGDKSGGMFSSIGIGLDHNAMKLNRGVFTYNTLSLLTDTQEGDEKRGRRTWLRSLFSKVTRY